jgi:hypothetical protein
MYSFISIFNVLLSISPLVSIYSLNDSIQFKFLSTLQAFPNPPLNSFLSFPFSLSTPHSKSNAASTASDLKLRAPEPNPCTRVPAGSIETEAASSH